MKKTLLATAFTLAATGAFAGTHYVNYGDTFLTSNNTNKTVTNTNNGFVNRNVGSGTQNNQQFRGTGINSTVYPAASTNGGYVGSGNYVAAAPYVVTNTTANTANAWYYTTPSPVVLNTVNSVVGN